ncbi:hypothetical protein B0O80DRAFT_428375 [Mortierella sp. GBAus27b]|nr:hypothetical protein B0O80DRAFT_428375 [Mortierella sp. GBAus27b]
MNSTNNGHNKGYSGIKGLSFLKSQHSSQDVETGSHSNSSIDTKTPSKLSIKNSKPNKSDQHHSSPIHTSPQPQPSGVASFNAIIRSQITGNVHDERIMMEEWLQKRSNSLQMVWKRRWCVLRDDCLFYYRSKTDSKPLGVLHLADFSILTSGPDLSRKSKFTFRLSSSEPIPNEHQHHLFIAETPQAFELWLEATQSHINHALARLESLGPLDTPDHHRQGSRDKYDPYGPFNHSSSSFHNQPTPPEQSTIDRVLDRLQLDDPTLSDMNDPSALIIPAHDHGSMLQRTQRHYGRSRPDLDDSINGWSPSIRTTTTTLSSSLYTGSPSMDHQGAQGSPIVIRSGIRYGLPGNSASGSFSPSTASSFTEPYSNYSSSTEISSSGNSGNSGNSGSKNNVHSRGSFHTLDLQAKPGLHSRGSHSASSSVAGYSPQYAVRTNGPPFAIETNFSPSTSTATSPLASPKLLALSSTSGYAVPPSPRTLFYKLDSNASPVERKDSNASSASISTIDSDSEETAGTIDHRDNRGLTLVANEDISHQHGTSRCCKRANSSSSRGTAPPASSSIFFGKKPTAPPNRRYCTENDIHPLEKEERSSVVTNDKKTKKLWSGRDGGASSGGLEKTPPSWSDKSSNKTKRGMSHSLDTDNPMFKGLVLISSPIKKSSGSSGSSISNSKGHSKSMTSLAKGSPEMDMGSYSGYQQPPPVPYHGSSATSSSSSSSSSRLPGTRARSPSVSALDEASYRPTAAICSIVVVGGNFQDGYSPDPGIKPLEFTSHSASKPETSGMVMESDTSDGDETTTTIESEGVTILSTGSGAAGDEDEDEDSGLDHASLQSPLQPARYTIEAAVTPSVTLAVRVDIDNVPNNLQSHSPMSPTSPSSPFPPSLPKRSPFRSAPIPQVQSGSP